MTSFVAIVHQFLRAIMVVCVLSCASCVQQVADPTHAVLTTEDIVKSTFPVDHSRTEVLEIDGKEINSRKSIRITPGYHVVLFSNKSVSFSTMASVKFEAKAGQTYVAKSDQSEGLKIKFWIENKTTGKYLTSVESPMDINPKQKPGITVFVPVH